MPTSSSTDSRPLKAVMSVAEHVEQLGLSRARFYELVNDGFFMPPVYSLCNRRPMFLNDMAERNRLAKETGIGVNGSVRVFYRRVSSHDTQAPTPRRSRGRGRQQVDNRLSEISSAMRRLGMESVTQEQVATVVVDLFPSGFDGMAMGDIIRAVFRQLQRPGTAR